MMLIACVCWANQGFGQEKKKMLPFNRETINAEIQKVLDDAVASGKELGTQVAVYLDGELIVNAYSGWTDTSKKQKVTDKTLFPVASPSKGSASAAVHRLVEKGLMSYDMKVASVWPEFGCNGKEDLTLEDIMSHRCGQIKIVPYKTLEEFADWDGMLRKTAEYKVTYKPGTVTRYLSLNYSWFLGGTVEKAVKKPMRQVIQEEIIEPLKLDSMYFGTDVETDKRIAINIREEDMNTLTANNLAKPNKLIEMLAFDKIRHSCLCAFTCYSSAHDLAKVYAAIIGSLKDTPPLLKPETLKLATTLHRTDPLPEKITTWELFGLGFVLSGPQNDLGQIFGHGGAGGSEAQADQKNKLVVVYTCNTMHSNTPVRNKVYDMLGLKPRPW